MNGKKQINKICKMLEKASYMLYKVSDQCDDYIAEMMLANCANEVKETIKKIKCAIDDA